MIQVPRTALAIHAKAPGPELGDLVRVRDQVHDANEGPLHVIAVETTDVEDLDQVLPLGNQAKVSEELSLIKDNDVNIPEVDRAKILNVSLDHIRVKRRERMSPDSLSGVKSWSQEQDLASEASVVVRGTDAFS